MIMTKNFFHINFLPPPLSHKFSNEEKKKLTSMQYQHTKQLICNIKSINLVRHSLLSVTEHVSQTTKSCFIPITLPLGSSCLLPFLHVHFHVVVNRFPHLSIATTPNNSLPASWVKKMCPHVMRVLWNVIVSLPSPPPPKRGARQESGSVSTLDLDHLSSWPIS